MPGKGSAHSVAADIQNIRQILQEYEYGFPVLKELIQNADDAGASQLDIGWFPGFPESSHPLLQGPFLFATNDAPFTEGNARSLRNLGLSDKPGDYSAVGKFGIGLKSLFHFCEAFFFIGSDGSGPPIYDIYNPWSPEGSSNEPEFHKEWDDCPIEENRFIEFLTKIRPDVSWSDGSAGWFSLFAPFRKSVHCKPNRPIMELFPGDSIDPFDGLRDETSKRLIGASLPILRNLTDLRFWIPGEDHVPEIESSVRLTDLSERSRWSGDQDDTFDEPHRFQGQLESNTGEQGFYAGIELHSQDNRFQQFKDEEGWPRRLGLMSNGEISDDPEKGAPHTALSFVAYPAGNLTSGLTTAWSVFLPVGSPNFVSGNTSMDISLSLHGYFFLDRGRKSIDFPSGADTTPRSASVQTRWNEALRNHLLLPYVLPALAHFVASSEISEEETTDLTSLLSKSELGRSTYAGYIRRDYQWVFVLGASEAKWSLLDSKTDVLRMPDADVELVYAVFPQLTTSSYGAAFTLDNWPSFPTLSNTRWPEEVLLGALKVPDTVFEDGNQTSYFVSFLDQRKSDISASTQAREILVETARRMIRGYSSAGPSERHERFSKIIAHVPKEKLVSVGGQNSLVRDQVLQGLASLDIEVLIVPSQLMPIGSPPDEVAPAISIDDGKVILDFLSNPKNGWSGPVFDRIRSAIALDVIRKIGDQRTRLLDLCADQQLFRGIRCDGTGEAAFSYRELTEISEGRLLFSGRPSDQDLGVKISRALPDIEIIIVHPDICDALISADGRPADLSYEFEWMEVLAQTNGLSGNESDRAPLLEALVLISLDDDEDDEFVTLWKQLVRYLLHGEYSHRDAEDLLIISTSLNKASVNVWENLARAALSAGDEAWRVPSPNLATLIAPQHYDALRLSDLTRESVIQLVEEIGPGNISCKSLETYERQQVVREVDNLAVLRSLPIHESITGELIQIGPDTYLQDEFPIDDPISNFVDIVSRDVSDPHVEFRQKQLVEGRLWNSEAVLRTAINLDSPYKHYKSILAALRSIRGQLPRDIASSISEQAWLLDKTGKPWAPRDVFYLRGFNAQLERISDLFEGIAITSESLQDDLQDEPTLALLTRHAFPRTQEILEFVGQILAEEPKNRIGLSDQLRLDDNFVRWLSVATEQDGPPIPVAPLLSEMLEASDGRYKEDVRKCVVPALLKPIPADMYVSVLNSLSEQQGSNRPDRTRYLDVHSWYLEEACKTADFRLSILPEINLRNRNGVWKSTSQLCTSRENISDEDLLHQEQAKIIGNVASVLISVPDLGQTLHHPKFRSITEYLKAWETSCSPAILGAFAALLGDESDIRKASEDWLSDIRWEVDSIRNLFDWTPQPERSPSGWIAANSFNDVMEFKRFKFEFAAGDEGDLYQVANLIGEPFGARFSKKSKT